MKRLLRQGLIGIAAAGFVLAAGAVLTFNRSALGWQALSVPTGSMRPTMQPGSLVVTHRVPISTLRVGDIITHTNPLTMHTTLTHRIVKEYRPHGIPTFITKGDANPSPDPPVVGGLVQGKVMWHVPYVGALLMWSKTWLGIAVLVHLPALLIMIHETKLLAAYLRQMKPYHLEGWAHEQTRERGAGMRPKWAIAASSAIAVAGIAVGFQTAGAVGGRGGVAQQALLVLNSNAVASKAAATSQTSGTRTNTDQTATPSGDTALECVPAANEGSLPTTPPHDTPQAAHPFSTAAPNTTPQEQGASGSADGSRQSRVSASTADTC